MSDEEVFIDEDGNVVDPAELAAGEYEVVDDAAGTVSNHPAAQLMTEVPTSTGPTPKAPKALLAVGAAVVALVLGGVVYGAHSIGSQNTAGDIKSAAQGKKNEIESSYRNESSSVRGGAEAERAGIMPVTACGGYTGSGLAAAAWTGDQRPSMRLKITSITDLPSGFRDRAGDLLKDGASQPSPISTWADPSQGAGPDGGTGPRVVLLQLTTDQIGAYTGSGGATEQGGSWWKATASTSPVRIAGEGPGTGTDQPMRGACRTDFQPGDYNVASNGSTGDRTRLAAVIASGESKSTTAWAIVGTKLAQLTLEHDGSASSSPAPTPEN
ncbi:hypothetical protein [Gordonia sp. 852002-51296_SCH5728562-b]|uniref:hypothetical protein n=1 Tax=Gordonia sp. 852002-51296_SCH5728562-b TaxID=1834101 RepID=UPI0007EC2923|nr:hypothetical protein [Gordonia sp. 852002-51296_SCH5728562-b]OBA43983.1 hypothetical protein A5766_00075 [Gordonia sp. 852002-51296_SCH5728562-b]